jgi:hypothetical protein
MRINLVDLTVVKCEGEGSVNAHRLVDVVLLQDRIFPYS